MIVPLTSWGLQVNPEFTFSDTHPVPTNPLLASHDRLYRGTLNVTFPVPLGAPGSTTGRITTEVVDELNTLPVFGVVLSHDRLTVLRGALTWDGALQSTSTALHAEGVLSEGVTWFGARSPGAVATPTSRGSDPRFTKLEVTLGATQSLPYGASLILTGRGQTSFDRVLPSSETFDLTGHAALSSYSQGALVSDAGLTERAQLERTWIRKFGRLGLATTPYAFVSEGQAVPAAPDAITPRRVLDYGLGLRLDTSGFPWMSAPSVSVEYGHASPDRGLAPRDYVQAILGVQF